MRSTQSYFLSGLIFVFLGTLISGLGFGGIVLLGKVTTVLLDGSTPSNLVKFVFSVIYAIYLFVLIWFTGKIIVPKYTNKSII
jgi:hypothetical protein